MCLHHPFVWTTCKAAVKPAAFLLSFAKLSCHLVEALINHLKTTLLLLTASKITIFIAVSNTNPMAAAVLSLDSLVWPISSFSLPRCDAVFSKFLSSLRYF